MLLNFVSNTENTPGYYTFNNNDNNNNDNNNDIINYESNREYSLCIMACCLYILYFIMTIPVVFIDLIFVAMYGLNDMCYKDYNINNTTPFINIKKWLLVSGLLGYVGLIILILLRRVYTEDSFRKNVIKITGYVINGFVLIWSGIGTASFFMFYYGSPQECFGVVFYNYLFIRIILAYPISLLKFLEVYCS